jgi:hypothetical protein
MIPKNGDIFLRDNDQIVIFFDTKIISSESDASAAITAIFSASGKWGQTKPEYYKEMTREITEDNSKMTYLGNMTYVFKKVLDYGT